MADACNRRCHVQLCSRPNHLSSFNTKKIPNGSDYYTRACFKFCSLWPQEQRGACAGGRGQEGTCQWRRRWWHGGASYSPECQRFRSNDPTFFIQLALLFHHNIMQQQLLNEKSSDSSVTEWVAALPRMLSAPYGHANILPQVIEVALSDAVPSPLVEKMMQAVARFAPQNDATASALLTLLECQAHPLPVIHALGSICVGCSDAIVSRAMLLLQACASTDRTLVVAALGAMASMPLKDHMKRAAFDTAVASLAYISDADAPSVSRAVLTACAGSGGSGGLQSQAVACVRAVCSSINHQHASLVHEEVAAAAKADTRTWKALLAVINTAQPWAPFDAALALLLLPCRRFRPAINAAIHRALQTSAISPEIFAPIFAAPAPSPAEDHMSYSGGGSSRSNASGGGALLFVDSLLRAPTLPQPMQWMACVIVPLIRRSRWSSEVAAQLVVTGAAAVSICFFRLTLLTQRCRPPCSGMAKEQQAGLPVQGARRAPQAELRICCSTSPCSTAKHCPCMRLLCCRMRSNATTNS